MNQIKFRVWNKKLKKMYPITQGSMIGTDFEVGIWDGGWELCEINANGKSVVCGQELNNRDDGILMQFTGFKIKGEEVYENDIIENDTDWYEVVWNESDGQWWCNNIIGGDNEDIDLSQLIGDRDTCLEGNRYETPQLLDLK